MTTRILLIGALLFSGCSGKCPSDLPVNFSGIYPHLAYYNNEGECGTGAVVPWADRLWVITYGPHLPFGSSDKLYEIMPDLQIVTRKESIGGTPANRMIHRESNQLFIGPYTIDANRKVRVIPYEIMPGRHTGNGRHLFEPAGKIYYGTMEEGFYEVDVNTLEVNTLYKDGNVIRKEDQMAQENLLLLGAHGKGLYSGQGVMVYSNNGETGQAALESFDIEAGALYEWNGYDWKLIRRNQFVEVTGPGGIYGNGIYSVLKTVKVAPESAEMVSFNEAETGEWIRVSINVATTATVSFNYSASENRQKSPSSIFQGLSLSSGKKSVGDLLYGLGNDRRALGMSAVHFENGQATDAGYYELDEKLTLLKKDDPDTHSYIKDKFAIPHSIIDIDESSVLIIDDKNRHWRLPLGESEYEQLTNAGHLRICREVVTERDLFNAAGTFYELPAENADGFAKIRPVASHSFRIHDYASYRGLLIMTGIDPGAKTGGHVVWSDDGKAAVWVGEIDDLWEIGKPIGYGGPWKNSAVKAGEPSDPYLIAFYDKRSLEISHDSEETVAFNIEVEPIGHGPWMLFKEVSVEPGENFAYRFPKDFQARWIRFIPDKDCSATAWLEYK